jgi:hypothetical protein
MFKIYGKGETILHNEFGDGRTNTNFLQDFISSEKANFLDLIQPIKEIISQQYEVFDFLERVNNINLLHYGVLKDSFFQEFKMTEDDVAVVNIFGKEKRYVRLPPGIAVFNKNVYLHKPAVVLGSKQLEKVFDLERDKTNFLEIKYDYITDTYKCSVQFPPEDYGKPTNKLEYPSNSWNNENIEGYKHSAKLLEALYHDPSWESFFVNKVGDDLTKINIERLVELVHNGTYYWVLTQGGNIELTQTLDNNLKLCSFQYEDGIVSNIDNTHHLYQTWGQPQLDDDGSILFESPNGLKFIDETGSSIILKNTGELFISNGTATIKFDGRSVEIDGDFNVTGTSSSTGTATLTVSSNIIELNVGIEGEPPLGMKSGLLIHRGNQPDYHFIFDENDLTLKGGVTGDLKAVSQRELVPISQGVPFWDAVEKIFKTSDLMIWNGSQLMTNVDRVGGLRANDNVIGNNDTTLATKNKVKTYVDNSVSAVQSELTTHRSNVSNPHSVTQSQVGLGNVPNWNGSTNVNLGNSNSTIPSQAAVKAYIDALDNRIPWAHFTNTNNPHATTKAQVGLGNVPNWKPLDTTNRSPTNWQGQVFDDEFVSAALIKGYVDFRFLGIDFTHFGNTSNPHSVTKAQVGLGNVPNWTGITTSFGTPTDLQFPSAKLVKDYVDNRIENHDGEHEDLFYTKAQINGFNNTTNNRITTEVGTLNTRITTEVNTLNSDITSINSRITNENESINTRITTEVNTLDDKIVTSANNLNSRITTEVNTLNSRITTEVNTLNGTINQKETEIYDKIDSVENDLENKKADKLTTYTKIETNNLLNLKADLTYVNGQLDLKADISKTYNKQEVDGFLDLKSNVGHTHPISDISDSTLAGRNIVKTSHNTGGVRFYRVETNGNISLRSATDLRSDISAEPSFSKNTAFNKNFGNSSGSVCEGNDSRLSDDRTPKAHTHSISNILVGDKSYSEVTINANNTYIIPSGAHYITPSSSVQLEIYNDEDASPEWKNMGILYSGECRLTLSNGAGYRIRNTGSSPVTLKMMNVYQN